MTRAGCSYFGVRIPRHVRRDMADLAARGYTGVLHTFSENDLAYYRGTMAEIVAASHAEGLYVQASPWGLGRTFGGEAESRWVAFHPEECQVMDDGRRVAAACLNSSAYRDFCKEWAGWVLECGVDAVFWDEPAWVVPIHVGVDDESRWTCRCDRCAERFGAPIPAELTPEVQAFREASVVDFLREVVAHVAASGGANTICLLPSTEGNHGISDWNDVASLPGLTTFATDPYWKHWNEPAGPFVRRFARLLRETTERHGVAAQLWVPSFGLVADEIPELEAALAGAREEGVDDLWTWGYEACGNMTHLATPDSPAVWEAASAALTGRRQLAVTETARPDLADLDVRPTRDLVRLLNSEDVTVPAAVAEAGDALAAAIDAIAERLGRGGRLIYVGAGTSGALAALDAAECGPTFGSPPGEVLAIVADGEAAEDDSAAATTALLELPLLPEDCVVAVSASGSTPFALAALATARAAGALTVAVTCVRRSVAGTVAEHDVAAVVGPEVLAGSTRLKAGTAQKLLLNTISTVAMIRLGRTYGGLMVGVAPDNAKLRERSRRNVVLASGAPEEQVDEAFAAADGDARVALVSILAGVDADSARARLDASGGSVRKASGRRLDGARQEAEAPARPAPEWAGGRTRLGVEAALVHGELVYGDVEVEDGRIETVGIRGGTRGRIAIPGFVDLQVNGYGGVDFLSASQEDYARAGEALLLSGVTAYQPTFITSAEAAVAEALQAMPETASASGPRILGAHLEGPFLSPERPGTHPLEHLRAPDVALLDRLLDAGNVTQMTLAPELPGADALIERLRERGVAISAGHTNATAADAEHAFDLGVGAITHVFNAMRPFRSRDPGIAGVALTRPDVVITMVVDGHHLADETVRLVWACAAGRVALITDAIAPAGTAVNGTFQLGEVSVEVGAGAAPMRQDGTLAGTVLTMIDAVRNLHALGVPFEDAVGAASTVPARLIGRTDIGVLEPGAAADIVVLDDRLEIQSVLCSGLSDVVARD